MSHALRNMPVTIAEFDAFMDAQPEDGTKWELIDGQILAMTNPNARHGRIVANLAFAIKPASDKRGCDINIGGMRVQADNPDGVDKTIPDITVTCGAWLAERTYAIDPVLVVEVLSPSTMDFDRGDKLQFYKSISAAQDVVIVYQDEIRVEHYSCTGADWAPRVFTSTAALLDLVSLAVAVPLAHIYAGAGLLT